MAPTMKYNALDKAQDMRHGARLDYLEATIRRYESLLEFMDDKLTLAGAEIVRLKAELAGHLHNDEQNNR